MKSISTKLLYLIKEVKLALWKEFKEYSRYPLWFISDMIALPMWLLFFMLPAMLFVPEEELANGFFYRNFYWGWVFLVLIYTSLRVVGMSIRKEQINGTLELLFSTNANRIILFIGRAGPLLLDVLITSAYTAVIFHTAFNVSLAPIDFFLTLYSLAMLMVITIGFSALYGAAILKFKEPAILTNLLQIALIFLTGAFYPIENLGMISYISLAIPLTYAVDLARHAALGTPPLIDERLEVFLVFFLALLVLLASYAVLKFLEKENKRKGTLAFY
ncbi:MAG: hypothetical protein DRJ38_04400 [Thermoprotei archaeon]|nr:MAG: hypothetical protein DRJ38_04400 [Thermoprotei archaeon]